jgi:ADP-heptose:LPS heptosyltransferase
MRSYRANALSLQRRLIDVRAGVGTRPIIAVSQVVHLGDIVACEPVVRLLRQDHPNAFIVFALHLNYRELADTHPDIDHVLPLICISEWARFAHSPFFDRVVDLNIYGRTCGLCGEPWHKRDGNNGVTCDNYYHFGNLLQIYCKSAGVPVPPDGPKVFPRPEDMEEVDSLGLPECFVALHSGSNESDRRLPPAAWRTVVDHINSRWHLPVIEIGLEPLLINSKEGMNVSLCGELSVLQTAEVIRRSALYLGSDSGPAHLANAVGAYGIIALGHYRHFQQYLPFSGSFADPLQSEVLHYDGPLDELPANRIIKAIDNRLSIVMNFKCKRD